MPENAEMVDSVNAQAQVDSEAAQEVNPSMEDSSPKTYTADELDAAIKKRIDKQNARHAEEMAELVKKVKELEERSAQAEAERAELQKKQDLASWTAQAAAEYGVPGDLLRGSNLEELMEHAKVIKAAIPSYPVLRESGEPKHVGATKESILSISNEKERLAAIRENIELFK